MRDNILFGGTYDRHWYKKVIHVCALEKDFSQLPYGDRSLVGDKGVLLSGGQKARINLARAIYRQASIYIMDDPLSAVDTQVGKYLFSECICKHLANKTRILVTHQLQYLKNADLIILMNHVSIEIRILFTFLQHIITSKCFADTILPLLVYMDRILLMHLLIIIQSSDKVQNLF